MITIYKKHQFNCLHFSSVAIIDLHFLITDLELIFSCSYDNDFIFIRLYKTIFRFNLFNLPIDHLHKLISPLSIQFIRMELRLHYVCIPMYCDIFASGLLFTEITKRFELNWFNVAITATGRLGLRWLPTVSWKVGKIQIFAFSNRSLGRGVAAYTYF